MKKKIAETIRLLIYKQHPKLIETLDLNDEPTFLEPLIFSYFNQPNQNSSTENKLKLEEILQGYYTSLPKEIKKESSYNEEGIAYIPKLGYFKKKENTPFDTISYIPGTPLEILPYKVKALNHIFKNFRNEIIPNKEIEITKNLYLKYKNSLSSAISIIKKQTPDHYSLIENYTKKIVLFKTAPENTNSFATLNAHGIAFLNTYQEDYDEVFFIDDIAHQTGHIITSSLAFDKKDFFLIDETINVRHYTEREGEYRSFYTLFHALYTYYTTLLCLTGAYSDTRLTPKQKTEILARIGFYLIKYKIDLDDFQKIVLASGGIKKVLTETSQTFFTPVLKGYSEFNNKFHSKIKNFTYLNQPYNFTFKNFLLENTIN